MNRNELTDLLARGLSNSHLRQLLTSVRRLIEPPAVISISDDRPSGGLDREAFISECRFRNAVLAVKRGLTPREGWQETLRSLAESDCEQIWIVMIKRDAEPRIIDIIVDRNDVPIGCMIGVVSAAPDGRSSLTN